MGNSHGSVRLKAEGDDGDDDEEDRYGSQHLGRFMAFKCSVSRLCVLWLMLSSPSLNLSNSIVWFFHGLSCSNKAKNRA